MTVDRLRGVAANGNSSRVLIVDDEALNLKVLSAKLAPAGYTIITANNGADAIRLAREEEPDIILLDIMMPDMDGYEVIEHLKANVETAYIPIVLVTALEDTKSKVKGLEAGADDFLSKPVNTSELLARVSSFCKLNRLHNELRTKLDCRIQSD